MKVSNEHRLILEEGEGYNLHFEVGKNFKPALVPQYLIFHATERPHVQSEVNAIRTGPRSAHLVVGKDGNEIVQLGAFDQVASHAGAYNKTSLAITLDYPGDLLNISNHFKSIDNYDPSQILYAIAENDWKVRPWPLYPKAQLDALLAVSQALLDNYASITGILAHDEISVGELDPGPAFPRTLFREKLLSGRGTLATLEETNQSAHLRAGPGDQYRLLFTEPLPAGTQVSIFGEQKGWVFIEALAELEGSPWVVGWVEMSRVSARRYVPVVRDPLLFTQDGRQYTFIPAFEGNYEAKHTMEAPQYIVMHFTTGTQMQSTINWFQSPAAGVSTHLLIGRDGRVVQFVPFNRRAYHCGFGYWEGESNLNRLTIGIELDNAGYLSFSNGQWKRKGTPIDPGNVEEAVHWKETRKRGWEKFSPVQLQVALEIVKELVRHFNIQDILGHDMINLINRTDPGPLFPIEDWREEIFGRRQPAYRTFTTLQETEIYANQEGVVPNLNHPQYNGRLPERSSVRTIEVRGSWALVKVLAAAKGGFSGKTGWVFAANIRNNKKVDKTTAEMVLYKKLAGAESPPPPVRLKGSPLPTGTRVRIQQVRGPWTLVFVLDPIKKIKWMEGWVKSETLQPPIDE